MTQDSPASATRQAKATRRAAFAELVGFCEVDASMRQPLPSQDVAKTVFPPQTHEHVFAWQHTRFRERRRSQTPNNKQRMRNKT